jgi:hypothetical protein
VVAANQLPFEPGNSALDPWLPAQPAQHLPSSISSSFNPIDTQCRAVCLELPQSHFDWLRRKPDAFTTDAKGNRMCEVAALFIPKIGLHRRGWILMGLGG